MQIAHCALVQPIAHQRQERNVTLLEQLLGNLPMAKADRDVRMQIMLQPEELAAIEDWRFAKRMPSRASAVRELIRRGLAAEGFNLAQVGKRSSSFGVTDFAEENTRRRGKKRDES